MSLYSQININKRRTFYIMVIFIAVISAFFYFIGKYFESPGFYFAFGLTFSLVSTVGSYFYSDKIVLLTVGAKPASKKEYFDFYTVAENLSIASGLPLPKLYIIDDPAPNAFATGRDPKHSVVAATTGLLQILNRSELEGVIAHELSHIKNYDILLTSVVSVLVGTLALTADWISRSLFWGRGMRDRDNDRKSPLAGVLLIVVLILAPIAATLIQLAISRRREFLADADGSLLTRYPQGLAGALEKISGYQGQMRSATTSTAHLFISNPFKNRKTSNWLMSLFSTHPPVEERIKILRSM